MSRRRSWRLTIFHEWVDASSAICSPHVGKFGVGLVLGSSVLQNSGESGELKLQVETILPGGAAAASQQVHVQDEIIEVDGKGSSALNLYVKCWSGCLSMTLCRPDLMSP